MTQYDDWRKQEALKTLGDPANLRPMLNGMISRERLDAYFEVARDIGVDDEQWRLLREHRTYLNERNSDHSEEEEEFRPASEIESQPAVADGGAEVVEADDDEDGWEPSEDQEVVEYEGEQRESLKQDVLPLLRENVDDADVLREKLEAERDSDRVRPHALDALEERLAEVEE